MKPATLKFSILRACFNLQLREQFGKNQPAIPKNQPAIPVIKNNTCNFRKNYPSRKNSPMNSAVSPGVTRSDSPIPHSSAARMTTTSQQSPP